MIQDRSFLKKTLALVLFGGLLMVGNRLSAQDVQAGKALFETNCTTCHAINKQVVGPALAHVADRWPDKKELHAWIRNNAAVIASGFPYAVGLKQQFGGQNMNIFASFTDKDIDNILAYIASQQDLVAGGGASPTPGTAADNTNNANGNSLIFGIITLILALVALILLQINSNLRKMTDDKEGIKRGEPVPFYRNKAYIALVCLIAFLAGGYYLVQGAIGLGRQQGYEPVQPIFFSHRVHAGINQISCLYCHSFALEGKHANIPSVNVCLNCHMGINSYSAKTPLYRPDGTEVNGTAEIQKLYKYAGWDPTTRTYNGTGQPIQWVRIHNLPAHVFFSHEQHTNAGKVQCQTCHGEIQKMDEVHQFAPLSMGWCINCHRTTKVQFASNGFYSIYTKFQEDMKAHTLDSVTVMQIGGTECQKCHY